MFFLKKPNSAIALAAVTVISGLLMVSSHLSATELTGAGATFPYPIYSKWAAAYKEKTGVNINYQAIGSGGGLKQIVAKTVDFGASDAPQTIEWQNQNQIIQFPMVVSGIVPIVNIKGLKSGLLKMSGTIIADIYLGKITKWSDPAIKAMNPLLALPDMPITPIYRNDGSGTTYNFSSYLAKVSATWREKIGVATALEWPVGLGAKGNDGVSSLATRVNGSIAYVESNYAKQSQLPFVLVQNKQGNFPMPTIASYEAAAANANWPAAKGFFLTLSDQPGKESWPIASASFILIQKNAVENTEEMFKFFDWAYRDGDRMARSLDYAPIPIPVVNFIQSTWTAGVMSNGKPVWNPK
ncbi:MAG: phosphate ABC transporter substrate-binding protein PstS [Candidatus Pacebacteria bacterium]|nr:phosphate ABC transporter substrate-binding protein PstS [Candidatus Paceibacterota bacterium]